MLSSLSRCWDSMRISDLGNPEKSPDSGVGNGTAPVRTHITGRVGSQVDSPSSTFSSNTSQSTTSSLNPSPSLFSELEKFFRSQVRVAPSPSGPFQFLDLSLNSAQGMANARQQFLKILDSEAPPKQKYNRISQLQIEILEQTVDFVRDDNHGQQCQNIDRLQRKILNQTTEGRARLKRKENGISSPAMLNRKNPSVNLTVNIIMETNLEFKEIQEKLVDFKLHYAHSAMGHPESDFRGKFFDFYNIDHINTVINIGSKII